MLSWAPGQPCNSHHARHIGQDTLVVPCLRCGSFLYHKSVGGRGCGQQPDALFPRLLGPVCLGDATTPLLESAFITHFWLSHAITLRGSRRVSPLLVYFGVFFCVWDSTRTQFLHHQRPPIIESTVFKHIHHKDRRQLQLSRRRWLHDCTASCVRSRSRHIFSDSLGTLRADETRQVRFACSKPQTSREADQDLQGGLTRQCNTRPSFLIMCCV